MAVAFPRDDVRHGGLIHRPTSGSQSDFHEPLVQVRVGEDGRILCFSTGHSTNLRGVRSTSPRGWTNMGME